MNGRLYDPAIGRFFSPDPFVVDATFTQDFNRYSYARNNPLMYTDPSGEFVWLAIGVGAAIFAYLGGAAANNVEFNPIEWDWKSGNTWAGMGIGAVAGGLGGWGFAAAGPAFSGYMLAAHGWSIAGSYMSVGTVFGFAAGYATGLSGGLLYSGGNLQYAHKNGMFFGGIGAAVGGGLGSLYALTDHAKNNIKKPYFEAELKEKLLKEKQRTDSECLVAMSYNANKYFGGIDKTYDDFRNTLNNFVTLKPEGSTSEFLNYAGFNTYDYNNMNHIKLGMRMQRGQLPYLNMRPNEQVGETHIVGIQRIMQWKKNGKINVTLADPQLGERRVLWQEFRLNNTFDIYILDRLQQ